jgi:UDP-N-acetylglucosamine/UDP-N-acetylgalactosamine diphosphorylase
MVVVPQKLRAQLRQHGQDHVLRWWGELDDPARRELLAQLEALDLDRLQMLFHLPQEVFQLPDSESIQPPAVTRPGPAARAEGERLLREGRLAVLLVAGGQGSRLGFERPKGLFPIGPVSQASLFQMHLEKVLALSRRFGQPVPLLIMTSEATHQETEAFLHDHRRFGLPAEQVFLFKQGTMPALDAATGKLLLEDRHRLCLSPDGHGGTLLALRTSGLLQAMREQGITQVFYFQVDNPLVKIGDPDFLGTHLAARAQVSTKVVPKRGPTDRMGNVVSVSGRCAIVEYSDLPRQWAERRGPDGELYFRWGNTAIHLFALEFLEQVTGTDRALPFHVARKKVPYLDETGQRVEPEQENALKFERFIFDVLPLAERFTVVETSRREEFEPLKNATGDDSPESVRRALANRAGDWLAQAGVEVPRNEQGDPIWPLEISPLLALDAKELATRLRPGLKITGPTWLQ